MGEKEAVDGTVKYDHLHLLVVLDRRDDLVQLGQFLRAEDVDRRKVKCHPPVRRQMSFNTYLSGGKRSFGTVHAGLHVFGKLSVRQSAAG